MQEHSNEAVDSKIYEALRTVKPSLADAPLAPDTKLDSLGMDSMTRLTLAFEMEERFGVNIVDNHLDTFKTVQEARQTVQDLLQKKSATAPTS